MFNTQIDVAAIMQEIKKNVVVDTPEVSNVDEVQRITEFIQNTRHNSEAHLYIGYVLPNTLKYPRIISKVITFAARVIRKSTRFITNDQIIVNKNTDACIKALVEREDAIARKAEKDITQLQKEVSDFKREVEALKGMKIFKEEILKLQKEKVALAKQISDLSSKLEIIEEKQKSEDVISDEMYLEFEKHFRGSKEDISRRQKFYVDRYLKEKEFNKNCLAVDLGCGRGEWLKMIETLGLHAVGIDTNVNMVEECKRNGCEAYLSEALTYLQGLDDNSVSVVSAFQVVEHLSKGDVIKLVKEAYRVLAPEGILILETPNICNIEVGASAFHLDPTHINPVHPELLKFIAEYAGFANSEIAYWNQESVEAWLQSVMQQEEKEILDSTLFRTVFETMKNFIYLSPDYALVAVK